MILQLIKQVRKGCSDAATRRLFCAFRTSLPKKVNVSCRIGRKGNCLSCLQKNGSYVASISLAPIRTDWKRDASQQQQRAGAARSGRVSLLTVQSFSINNDTKHSLRASSPALNLKPKWYQMGEKNIKPATKLSFPLSADVCIMLRCCF